MCVCVCVCVCERERERALHLSNFAVGLQILELPYGKMFTLSIDFKNMHECIVHISYCKFSLFARQFLVCLRQKSRQI